MTATTTAPATAERRLDVLKWGTPIDQSAQAKAANRALLAGLEALDEARETWATVRESVPTTTSIRDLPEGSTNALVRRLAVRLEQRAGKTLGLVSSSACGLWAVTMTGRVVEVESTTDGSDYLDGVRHVERVFYDYGVGAYVPKMSRYGDEWPVSDLVAFADTYEGAAALREDFLRA